MQFKDNKLGLRLIHEGYAPHLSPLTERTLCSMQRHLSESFSQSSNTYGSDEMVCPSDCCFNFSSKLSSTDAPLIIQLYHFIKIESPLIFPTDINMFPWAKLSLNFNLSLVVFLKAQFLAHYYFLCTSMILVTALKFQIFIYFQMPICFINTKVLKSSNSK